MKKISSDSISDWISAEEKENARQIQSGRTAAITWMGISRKSSGKVEAYLQSKGFVQSIIADVVASLKEDGYLDDERLAEKMVIARTGRKGESKAAIGRRMRNQGISGEAAEAALENAADDFDAALALVIAKFGRQIDALQSDESREDSSRARFALAQKAGRFLAGRGFTHTVVLRALRSAGLGIDNMDQD